MQTDDRQTAAGGGLADVLPLSPLQEGLLLHASLAGGGPDVYVVQLAVELEGPLDPAVVRLAGQAVLDRHANLRAGFRYGRSGAPLAVVPKRVELPWRQVDLVPLAAGERAGALAALRGEERSRPFDLARPPLIRFLLAATGPDRHQLVITNHHLLLDGWSTPLLVEELLRLIRAGGDPSTLGPVTPYRTYLAWLQSRDHRAAETAWRDALGDVEAPTLLAPGAAREPAVWPVDLLVDLPEATAAAVGHLCRTRGLTLSTVVQGAWGILLGRLLGRQDVTFGATVSGRPADLPGVEAMIGLFINTVPVRVRAGLHEPAVTVLERLQRQTAALLDHQHLGLVDTTRAAGHGELFDTLVVVENYPVDAGALAGGVDPVPGPVVSGIDDVDATHYPLTLMVQPGDRLQVRLGYRPDCFDPAAAALLGSRFARVLDALAADPEAPLGSWDLLRPEERSLLDRVNDTAVEVTPVDLATLFERQVAATPRAVAVRAAGEVLTYEQLDRRATALARLLTGAGVGPEAVVGLLLERSVELVVAVLAVHKAGGAYLPIDPAYPDERVTWILDDASPVAVVATSATAGPLNATGTATASVILDDPATRARLDEVGSALVPAPRPPVHPDHPAYLIYTSGSTGRPKGVMVSHRSIVNRLRWMQASYPLDAGDVVLLKTPATFDVSVWELLWAHQVGATLVVASPTGHRDPAYLARLIQAEGVTTVHFVPSMLQAFLAEPEAARCTSLKRILCSGEALGADLAQRCLQLVGAGLYNLYGPTEAAVDVTAWSVSRSDQATVPIGSPVWNTGVHVLDAALRAVPPGVPGELYLSGVQLARGYAGRPGLTAERFVASPWAGPGTRLYRTGDLARQRNDGSVEYLGRVDDQVKVRGVRIELGEVESALAGMDGVAQVAAAVREDQPGDTRLVAYAVAAPGAVLDPTHLRKHLAQRLPEALVPAVVVVVDALAVTANGKLDRRALPSPDWADAGSRRAAGRAPRDDREALLCQLVAGVLGLAEVGVDDDFFALGGHSLLATRLVARIRRATGAAVGIQDVFDAPTPARLARRLSGPAGASELLAGAVPTPPADGDAPVDRPGRASAAGRPGQVTAGPNASTDLRPVPPAERIGPMPLSYAQQRLWFVDRLEGPSALYNIPLALRLHGPLDLRALAEAWGDVVRRHAALRTTFVGVDGTPGQVVEDPAAAEVPLDVSPVAPGALDAELAADAGRPFRLDRDLPARARLLAEESGDHVLSLVVHHIAADGRSLAVVLDDLALAYRARQAGRQPGWPPPVLDPVDHAAWQRRVLGDGRDPVTPAGRLRRWWADHLAGMPEETELPADRSRPAVASGAGGSVDVVLPAGVHHRLTTLARGHDVTTFMVLHAALVAVLHRLGAGDDIPIGVPVAGRTEAEVEDLVGLLVNSLVLRVDAGGDPTFVELLARSRAVALDAYAHQELPFEQVVEAVQPERSLGRHPLFQVVLAHQPLPATDLRFGAATAAPVPVDSHLTPFDLAVNVLERPASGGLELSFVYATDRFDAATVAGLAERFTRVLSQVAEHPATPLSGLAMLGDQDRARLEAWAGAPFPDPPTTLPALFGRQVARTPEAVAVVDGDRTLTYRELDRRAEVLAAFLAGRGVGPEVTVGLLLERSVAFVVAVLGVHKAGGAYLPLDPDHPDQRLAAVLADARPGVVVTAVDRHPGVLDRSDVVVIDAAGNVKDAGEPGPPAARPALRPEHPAYVIYTSGSTGRPKGVVVTHEGVAKLLATQRHRLGVDAGSVLLQFAAPSFDVAFWELFVLLAGGRLVVTPAERRIPGPPLVELLHAHGVTHVALPPAFLGALPASTELPAGISVLVGTESVPLELARRWAGRCRMVNCYGPTEASVNATTGVCSPAPETGRPLPIGVPDPGVRAYVLDQRLALVAPGVAGELYLGGAGLARGYLGQPGLSAARFVADPFAGVGVGAGGRLYRTGDIVRWRPDGQLEIVGRADDQVQLRGFRVEPGEIVQALDAQPGVAQSVVVVREDRPGDRRLVGYVVPGQGAAPDPLALRAATERVLAAHLVPSAVVVLDALPTLVNGKVDRRALPAPDWAALATDRAPRNERETALRDLYTEVLGVAAGIDDDFFALGGDSIVSIRLVAAARRAGLVVTPRQVFEHRTVEALARVAVPLEAAPVLSPERVLVDLDDAEHRDLARRVPGLEEVWPLTPLQEGLVFLHALGGDGPEVYSVQLKIDLAPGADPGLLRRAGQALLDRHASLRAGFVPTATGRTVAVVAAATLPWREVDLMALAGAGQAAVDAEWRRVVDEERSRAFDPALPPLLRMVLVRLPDGRGGERRRLIVTNHHLVLDGWSAPVVLDELAGLYRAGGDAGALPPVVSYRQHLAWLAGRDTPAAEQAWAEALTGVEDPTLVAPGRPADPVLPEVEEVALDEAATAALAAWCSSHGVTLNAGLQAAWGLVLARWLGRQDVVFGATVSGRPAELAGVERMVGLFINTVPVRLRYRPGEPLGALVQRLHGEQTALLDHHHLGLSTIARPLGGGELFDTLVVFENYPFDGLPGAGAGDDEPLITGVDSADATHYPLVLSVVPGPSLRIDFEYRPDCFDRQQVRAVGRRLAAILRAIAADDTRPAGTVDLLTPSEHAHLAALAGAPPSPAGPSAGRGPVDSVGGPTSNGRGHLTEVAPRAGADAPNHPNEQAALLPDLFDHQVARDPGAVAVVADDGTAVSFGELHDRVGRLASLLVAAGAGPEELVGLCIGRTVDMVTGILAVHAAGAAYVPLDPVLPVHRLAFLLADTRPRMVLTTSDARPALAAALTSWGPRSSIRLVVLDHPSTVAELAGRSSPDPKLARRRARLRPQHPAYVIHTSGSTGRPKGVVVTHAGIANLFHSHHATLHEPTRLRAGRDRLRVGHAWPFAFDASWQPQLWLYAGHSLHVLGDELRRDPARLVAAIGDRALDFIELTPSLLAEVVEAGLVDDTGRCPLATVAFGGEAVPEPLWTRLRALPATEAVNLYGPTEATVDTLVGRAADSPTPVVGRAVHGSRVRVLDAGLQPVPVGVSGELHIGGAGLARGYLGRPGLTAGRFVADPSGDRPGAVLYRTGDLVRWRDDGQLEFLGRTDDQVKIRGFRVELGEVEAALAARPGVARAVAAVLGAAGGPAAGGGTRRLVGYVVARPGADLDVDAVRRQLAASLPEHLVPAAVVAIDAVPETANGKVDRAALPVPDWQTAVRGNPPRTDRERRLCQVMADVLGLDLVGVDDDFFALGGDSILAMRLAGRARRAGLALSPRQVLDLRTAEALAAAATEVDDASASDATTGVGAGEGPIGLTPVSRWLVELDAPIDRFNQSVLLQVPAGLTAEHLHGVLQAVLDHHDILRTKLVIGGADAGLHAGPPGSVDAANVLHRIEIPRADATDAGPASNLAGGPALPGADSADRSVPTPAPQVPVRPAVEPSVQERSAVGPSVPLRSAAASGGLDAVIETASVAAEAWLDPAAGRMLRAVWFDAGDAEPGRLLLVAHHLVVDGVSWRIILEDLVAADAGLRAGREPGLEPVGTSVRHWVQVLEGKAATPEPGALDAWLGVLGAGEPPLGRRPLDPRIDVKGTAEELVRTLPAEVSRPLLGLVPAALGGSVNDVLLAALGLAMAGWTGRPQTLVALEGHGREADLGAGIDLSRTVGWFTSIFPVRLDVAGLDLDDALAGGTALGEAVRRTGRHLASLPDRGVSYGALRHLHPGSAHTFAGRPEPQILFNYLGRFDTPDATDWAAVPDPGPLGGGDPAFPFTYALEINALTEDRAAGPELTVSWSWPGGLFDRAAIDRLATGWVAAISACIRAAAGGPAPHPSGAPHD